MAAPAPAAGSTSDGDAFRMMYLITRRSRELHALRDSLGVIVRAKLPIGPDGRNRPSIFPFGTATGRNAHARSPVQFSRRDALADALPAPARSASIWIGKAQEIGVAAARSGDLLYTGGLHQRRRLSRVGSDREPNTRSGSDALEEDQPRRAAENEVAAVGDQLRDEREKSWRRASTFTR